MSWKEANQHCKDLALAGQKDWRLPTYAELASLIDYTGSAPHVASQFPNTPTDAPFWSASVHAKKDGTAFAGTVDFKDGSTNSSNTDAKFHYNARCVRGSVGQVAVALNMRFQVSAKGGVVVDGLTGLSWPQFSIAVDTVSWDEATKACSKLQLDGGSWRLPSVVELLGVLYFNGKLTGKTMPPEIKALTNGSYWTSTPVSDASTAGHVWAVQTKGVFASKGKTSTPGLQAVCVR